MRHRCSTVAGVLAVLIFAAPPAAIADQTTQVFQGTYLRLTSVADWDAAAHLGPGESTRWDVSVRATPPEPTTMHLLFSAQGDAALLVDMAYCLHPWRGDQCPGGETVLHRGWTPPGDGSTTALAAVPSSAPVHLRTTIALVQPSRGATRVAITATVAEESASATSSQSGSLAQTGLSPSTPAFLAGGATVFAAVGLLLSAARRRARKERS